MYIADFNVAKIKSNQWDIFKMQTKTGTLAFSAPEMFEKQDYDEKVDLWAAGIVFYMMLSGEHPFDSGNISVS